MLTGKIALVTGASRGIGRAIALHLAAQGADLIVNYVRKRTAAQEVVEQIRALGRRAESVQANVAAPADIERLYTAVRAFGGLDILIANAASGVMEPLMAATAKHWQWTLDTNTWSVLALVQGAAELMRQRGGGHIVALSSEGSTRVLQSYGLVGASKAALESLIRYLAVELAPHDIVVNAVSPGCVDTDAFQVLANAQSILAAVRAQTPTGRLVTAEDVAQMVGFLCSPRSRMIVGQNLVLDGGYSLLYGPLPAAPPADSGLFPVSTAE